MNVTCPLPFGPPVALYVGSGFDPEPATARVDTVANAGVYVIRTRNLSHIVDE